MTSKSQLRRIAAQKGEPAPRFDQREEARKKVTEAILGVIDWSDGMGEISGLGGAYEDACRAMLDAGILWLRQHHGVEVDRMSELEEHIAAACPGGGPTGAMVGACMQHLTFIVKHGTDRYKQEMQKK